MSRRHTATSPEQRKLPRNGRTRIAVRLQWVSTVTDDKTGELVYEAIKDADGEIIQQRANRRTRRQAAFGTRLQNDGRPWRMSRDYIEPRKVSALEAHTDDDWLNVLAIAYKQDYVE